MDEFVKSRPKAPSRSEFLDIKPTDRIKKTGLSFSINFVFYSEEIRAFIRTGNKEHLEI
jgi:hypothetical protein